MHRQIVDRSWHVLIVLVASFLPSSDLLPYIEYFIRTSNNTLSHELMERCSRYLEICKKVGNRKEPPSIEEIDMLLVFQCAFFDVVGFMQANLRSRSSQQRAPHRNHYARTSEGCHRADQSRIEAGQGWSHVPAFQSSRLQSQ